MNKLTFPVVSYAFCKPTWFCSRCASSVVAEFKHAVRTVDLCPLVCRPIIQSASHCSVGLGMRGIPVSEKYRGIKSDGIIYRGLVKYRGIPPAVLIFNKLSSFHRVGRRSRPTFSTD